MTIGDSPITVDRTRVVMAAVALLFIRATAAGVAFQEDLSLDVAERVGQALVGGITGILFFFPLSIVLVLLLGGLLAFVARRVIGRVVAGERPEAAARRGTWAVLGVLTLLEFTSFAIATVGTGEPPAPAEVLTWLGAVVVGYPVIRWGVRPPETNQDSRMR